MTIKPIDDEPLGKFARQVQLELDIGPKFPTCVGLRSKPMHYPDCPTDPEKLELTDLHKCALCPFGVVRDHNLAQDYVDFFTARNASNIEKPKEAEPNGQ